MGPWELISARLGQKLTLIMGLVALEEKKRSTFSPDPGIYTQRKNCVSTS
jgi:hypothetical protein